MIRVALAALALSGCTVIEHVQVAPTLSSTEGLGCCVVMAEIPPSTDLSLKITKPAQTVEIKASARWKF